MKRIRINESDLRVMVNETVRRVIKEWGDPAADEYPEYATKTVDGYDLFMAGPFDKFCKSRGIDADMFEPIISDMFQDEYELQFDGDGKLVDDGGLLDEVENIQDENAKKVFSAFIRNLSDYLVDLDYDELR